MTTAYRDNAAPVSPITLEDAIKTLEIAQSDGRLPNHIYDAIQILLRSHNELKKSYDEACKVVRFATEALQLRNTLRR